MSTWRSSKTAWCTRCNREGFIKKARGNGENAPKGSRIYVCSTCWDRVELPTKFKSKPMRSKIDGRLFQSKKEGNRQPVLVALQNSGQISELRYQGPDFAFRIYSNETVDKLREMVHAFHAVMPSAVLVALREVELSMVSVPGKYRPDFTYHTSDRVLHVEDVKSAGTRTVQYRRNKALMLACFGIEVEEPEEGGVQQRARGCGVAGRGTGARLMGGR